MCGACEALVINGIFEILLTMDLINTLSSDTLIDITYFGVENLGFLTRLFELLC